MNFKFFSFLIPLAASALLTPVEKAFSQTVEHQISVEKMQHLVCVKEAQHLRCTVEKNKERNQSQGAVQKTEVTPSRTSALVTVVPQNPTQQRSVAQTNQYWTTNTITALIFLIFVCSNGLGLFLYKKHRDNRVTVLRQNIEALERLWKISNLK